MELEESDRLDYTRLASDATSELNRLTKGTSVSPMMQPTNSMKRDLLREIRNAVKKARGNVQLFAKLTPGGYALSVTPLTGDFVFLMEFSNGRSSIRRVAS